MPPTINLITTRMGHHSRASGYDRLVDFLPGRVVAAGERRPLWERVIARAGRVAIRRSGSRWYHGSSFVAEVKAAAHWANARGEVFHFLYGENSFRYLGNAKRFRPGNAIVCTYHTPPGKLQEVVRERRHLTGIDAVVVVSNVQREMFAGLLGEDRVHYVPHGIDVNYFRPGSDAHTGRAFECLFVGSHLRDMETLAAAARRLQGCAPQVRLTVVTKPELHRHFRGAANVRLYSGLSDAGLLALYQRAHVLLMPLLDCTANNGLLEGMACGLPIISTDIPGVRDYVTPDCGLFGPPGDATPLTQAVLALLEDPTRRHAMGKRSRERALEFRWENIARQMLAVYQHAST